jgi:hypothetical protein
MTCVATGYTKDGMGTAVGIRVTCCSIGGCSANISTSILLHGTAAANTWDAEHTVLAFGREFQWRKTRFREATVGFDRLEDPECVSHDR